MGLLDFMIARHFDKKGEAIKQANSHLQQMEDRIEVMERVCRYTECDKCKYGSSVYACEKRALIDMYNETFEDYVKKGLIKKGR